MEKLKALKPKPQINQIIVILYRMMDATSFIISCLEHRTCSSISAFFQRNTHIKGPALPPVSAIMISSVLQQKCKISQLYVTKECL